MVKSEWRLQSERAVLSFPDGKRILTKINRLPKKKQIAFFRAFNQHGVGVVTAYKKVIGKPHKFIYDKKCKTT